MLKSIQMGKNTVKSYRLFCIHAIYPSGEKLLITNTCTNIFACKGEHSTGLAKLGYRFVIRYLVVLADVKRYWWSTPDRSVYAAIDSRYRPI